MLILFVFRVLSKTLSRKPRSLSQTEAEFSNQEGNDTYISIQSTYSSFVRKQKITRHWWWQRAQCLHSEGFKRVCCCFIWQVRHNLKTQLFTTETRHLVSKMDSYFCLPFSFISSSAVTGRYTSFVVRDGDGVTLPCENATYNQNGCKHTSWLFSGAGNTSPVELVTLGQVGERARAKSDQLGVEENCALVLKKVKVEDVGRYSCRQVNESRQQQGPDAHVYLSVIISEYLQLKGELRSI